VALRRHECPPLRHWRRTGNINILHKVFIKSFCKSQFPQTSVNLSFDITNLKNKVTNLCGNQLLQNYFFMWPSGDMDVLLSGTGIAQATSSPASGIKSSFSIALICTTSRRIFASASANRGLGRSDLMRVLGPPETWTSCTPAPASPRQHYHTYLTQNVFESHFAKVNSHTNPSTYS